MRSSASRASGASATPVQALPSSCQPSRRIVDDIKPGVLPRRRCNATSSLDRIGDGNAAGVGHPPASRSRLAVVDPVEKGQGFAVIGVERQHCPSTSSTAPDRQARRRKPWPTGKALTTYPAIAGLGRSIRHAADVGFPRCVARGQTQQLIQSCSEAGSSDHRPSTTTSRAATWSISLASEISAKRAASAVAPRGSTRRRIRPDRLELALPLLRHAIERLHTHARLSVTSIGPG